MSIVITCHKYNTNEVDKCVIVDDTGDDFQLDEVVVDWMERLVDIECDETPIFEKNEYPNISSGYFIRKYNNAIILCHKTKLYGLFEKGKNIKKLFKFSKANIVSAV